MSRRGWGLFVVVSLLWGLPYLLAALSYAGGALVIKRAFSDIPLGSVSASLSVAALLLHPGHTGWASG